MLRNYILMAWRNMVRYKAYSAINLAGLTLGIASALLITYLVIHQLGADQHHHFADRTYRVQRDFLDKDGKPSFRVGSIAPAFTPHLLASYAADIEHMVRVTAQRGFAYKVGDKLQTMESTYFADADFFKVFNYELLAGDPGTALKDIGSIVLTEEAAKNLFGSPEAAMDKSLTLQYDDTAAPLRVTGVVKQPRGMSHFLFNVIISFRTLEAAEPDEFNNPQNFGSNNYAHYIVLKDEAAPQRMEASFPAFLNRIIPEHGGRKATDWNRLYLTKLTDIYLRSDTAGQIGPVLSIKFVYIFAVIAVFVLLIACINFVNLSTARAARRAKEVGVRKTTGASRWALMQQFYGESLFLTALALLFAIAVAELTLPLLSSAVGIPLLMTTSQSIMFYSAALGVLLLVGIVAGSYPALYLSSFQPTTMLRAARSGTKLSTRIRQGLVVLQFAISIVLIAGVAVILGQMDYVRTTDPGFNREHVLVLPANAPLYSKRVEIKGELLQNAAFSHATYASRIPTGRLRDSQDWRYEDKGEMKQGEFRLADVHIDPDYFATFQIELAAGRGFSHELASDSSEAIIINEATVKALGWGSAEAAIGKKLYYGRISRDVVRKSLVIGVVRDFHFENMHEAIVPMAFLLSRGRNRNIVLRIKPGQTTEAIAAAQAVMTKHNPNQPFTYTFLDQAYLQQYQTENMMTRVVTGFAILAIIISCLGLLGLAAYTAEQRLKEIGIRKVLGASVGNIVLRLSREYAYLVLAAALIAVPIAVYAANKWLATFAYHMQLGWGLFALTVLVAMAIALLTVSYITLRAALSNPVNALRTE